MTVPKVFLSGYAKLPDNTTAQKLYNHLVLVVTAESSTGTILDADCTMATELGRRFIRELLVGYALTRGPDPLVERLNQSYYGHLRKALQTCIKGICSVWGTLPEQYRRPIDRLYALVSPLSLPYNKIRRDPHAAVR